MEAPRTSNNIQFFEELKTSVEIVEDKVPSTSLIPPPPINVKQEKKSREFDPIFESDIVKVF